MVISTHAATWAKPCSSAGLQFEVNRQLINKWTRHSSYSFSNVGVTWGSNRAISIPEFRKWCWTQTADLKQARTTESIADSLKNKPLRMDVLNWKPEKHGETVANQSRIPSSLFLYQHVSHDPKGWCIFVSFTVCSVLAFTFLVRSGFDLVIVISCSSNPIFLCLTTWVQRLP